MTDDPDRDEIRRLMDERTVELDELYVLLADNAGLGADEINKAGAGKTFFSRIWAQQKERVCASRMVQAYMHDPNTADATDIVTHVLSLLVVVPGINMLIVACLAVRIGLRALCARSST